MSLKVVTIIGSYRENGMSAKLAAKYVEELEKTHQITNKTFNIAQNQLNGCHGCLGCKAHPDQFYCSQSDECFEILKEMVEADVVIFSYPVYWYYMPAQVKLLLDRTVSLFNWSDFSPKKCLEEKLKKLKFVCLCTCGSEGFEKATEPIKMLAGMVHASFDSFHVFDSQKENEKLTTVADFAKKF
ncbi:hypothetical protein EIN_369600 [Entamoeba invadens IP1]|uniref:Flavodoxin-like fold domain-containing protein n=1 Tax=Entamoeba invadens IP1 TaxID=370355 RepID=A0A0A1UBU9_ENTIV|nr:hypothetical protein EIN_369600 [Entamoeba invadens IP1]ELP92638.1 hypothetical protein EIN_369600 [Entamoeba invadens IP1]|eukprot:XP_004259409.1 hypothetical protein EIN_369600 [Entamoeba invadens IP1]